MFPAPRVDEVISVLNAKRYVVFKDPRGHDLNIVGIRTDSVEAERFNDWLSVFYFYDDNWNYFAFPATTDPGTFYRQNPLNVNGTAVLKPGQYRGVYKIGKHKNYKALQQTGDMTVYRDANRDTRLDTVGMPEDAGVYAINIHRANMDKASTRVGKWSAGCQVFQDPDHFMFFMKLCDRASEKFGNKFSYTLVEEGDFNL